MLRVVLRQLLTLCQLRATIEERAHVLLEAIRTIRGCVVSQESVRSQP